MRRYYYIVKGKKNGRRALDAMLENKQRAVDR